MAFGSRVRAWVGAREVDTLAALLLAAGGVWLFVELADDVLEGDTASVDERLLLMLRVDRHERSAGTAVGRGPRARRHGTRRRRFSHAAHAGVGGVSGAAAQA